MKRVKNARKALKVWEREAKSLDAKGYKKDPIESREQEYMRSAMANPRFLWMILSSADVGYEHGRRRIDRVHQWLRCRSMK